MAPRPEMTKEEKDQAHNCLDTALFANTPGKRMEAMRKLEELYLEEFLRLERNMKGHGHD